MFLVSLSSRLARVEGLVGVVEDLVLAGDQFLNWFSGHFDGVVEL